MRLETRGKRILEMRTRRGRVLVFVVLPLVLGLLTAVTGSLQPIFTLTMLFLMAPFLLQHSGRRFDPRTVVPATGTTRQDRVAGWWNRCRRFGFYASLSVLLMWALAFTRSALTDTWGGGDLLLAIALVIPLVVIFRRPPRTLSSTAEAR
ncbi:hypothetical protein QNO08_17105 [Arthrobacter sp. zg-Y820]|uniref:hypothetical protein n=1 Tax=unclassified Arthrobacter TaxID=235627 RepID=UPI001E33F49C|nr:MULTISPECIES: hypothetical protein [unclassified Arthrobacter]MCC9197357.1 hypothetical protein [Arthrobacter sp. zg-Y820]MDK1280223.1 hypothetical protein [Arthrobacter sp. zg.Y820]WIB09514.1 hypothetical protein QNO08_17105 [Arthrobacter sp. zg-Y820]